MTLEDIFYEEVERQRSIEDMENETLLMFSVADRLSIKNSDRYRKSIIYLSLLAYFFAILFFMFSLGDSNNLIIIGLLALLAFSIIFYSMAKRKQYHRKYLEYRVLAESLRIQFFLFAAGLEDKVVDMLPLLIESDIKWIRNVLKKLPDETNDKQDSIEEIWIKDQLAYHSFSHKRIMHSKKYFDKASKFFNTATVLSYFLILTSELLILNDFSVNTLISTPYIFKLYLGMLTAGAILFNSSLGKMALPERINNHERMIKLYNEKMGEIEDNGETREILLSLAEEYLTENSLWYAFLKQHKLEMIF